MKPGWDTVVLSAPQFEHLVAELYLDGNFLFLLDREDGRDSISVSVPDPEKVGSLGTRMKLEDLIAALHKAAEDLKR